MTEFPGLGYRIGIRIAFAAALGALNGWLHPHTSPLIPAALGALGSIAGERVYQWLRRKTTHHLNT